MSKSVEAQSETDTIAPVSTGRDLGIREAALLLVGAAFACMMFDLPDLAVVAGGLAIVAWSIGMVRVPRLTWQVTLAVGLGQIVTFVWWPDNTWAEAAIPLMWAGVVLVVVAAGIAIVGRSRRSPGQSAR